MKPQRCKECNAPIYSKTEKAMGQCTCCVGKARTKERQNRSHLQKPTVDKKADKKAVSTIEQVVSTRKNRALQGPNTARVCARIPEQAMIALQNEAKLAGMTLSTYLRGLILGAITPRKAAQVASKRV